MSKLKYFAIAILTLFAVSACTPTEQALWQSLTPDQQTAVIANLQKNNAPDICFQGAKNVENCKIGWAVASAEGYTLDDFRCLDYIVMHESSWYNVPNAAGGRAFGVPQAMTSVHKVANTPAWRNNVDVQIKWMIDYIDGRYSHPCLAKKFKVQNGWY